MSAFRLARSRSWWRFEVWLTIYIYLPNCVLSANEIGIGSPFIVIGSHSAYLADDEIPEKGYLSNDHLYIGGRKERHKQILLWAWICRIFQISWKGHWLENFSDVRDSQSTKLTLPVARIAFPLSQFICPSFCLRSFWHQSCVEGSDLRKHLPFCKPVCLLSVNFSLLSRKMNNRLQHCVARIAVLALFCSVCEPLISRLLWTRQVYPCLEESSCSAT